ncbi:hypothetical protein [Streptomyces sp. NPDC089799]|uniref:hypothetical protein n=1 Tax=Streptomyces sp. NPDC089799 TaxID=3155066 RepID=UPI00343D5B16
MEHLAFLGVVFIVILLQVLRGRGKPAKKRRRSISWDIGDGGGSSCGSSCGGGGD